jgi:hypothetical protein
MFHLAHMGRRMEGWATLMAQLKQLEEIGAGVDTLYRSRSCQRHGNRECTRAIYCSEEVTALFAVFRKFIQQSTSHPLLFSHLIRALCHESTAHSVLLLVTFASDRVTDQVCLDVFAARQ